MGIYIQFKCYNCGETFYLRDGGDGWVDEEGRFGFALHPGWEPIGQPHGDFVPSYFSTYICLECGQICHFLGANLKYRVQPNPQIIDHDELWFIQGYEQDESRDPDTDIRLDKTDAPCPRCGGRIVGLKEMHHHVHDREKCRKFGLPPLKSDSDAYPCPKCKANELSFHGFSQS